MKQGTLWLALLLASALLLKPSLCGQTVVAWGDNTYLQCAVPPQATNVVAVAAGARHSLALRADGSVVAWGSINYVPSPATNVIRIAAGIRNVALRADGTVAIWQSGGSYYVSPYLSNVVEVAAGSLRDYALTSDGRVFSVQIGFPLRLVLSNACAISAQGEALRDWLLIRTWDGRGHLYKQEGSLLTRERRIFDSADEIVDVAAGVWQHLGLRANGSLWSQGGFVAPEATNLVAMATHTNYSLGLQPDGALLAWGTSAVLNQYSPLSNVVSSSAGPTHALAVVFPGSAPVLHGYSAYQREVALFQPLPLWARAVGALPMNYTWLLNGSRVEDADAAAPLIQAVQRGLNSLQVIVSNNFGAVTSAVQTVNVRAAWAQGSDVYSQTSLPLAVESAGNIAAGSFHFLALTTNNTVIGWGKNRDGQASAPTNLTDVLQVAGGGEHSLALRRDGSIAAWGSNWKGQLSITNQTGRFVAVAAGAGHSLALREDGTLTTAGDRISGQADIALLGKDVVAIACGYWHNLALRADGSVLTAGLDYSIPSSVSNVVAIAAGWESCAALRSDGTVVVWGDNSYGQSNVPASATNLVGITAGMFHYAGVRADGTVVAWGREYRGTTTIPDGMRAWNGVACGEDVTVIDATPVAPQMGLNVKTTAIPEGASLVIPVRFLGSGPLTFQWYHNGELLPAATNRCLFLPRASLADAGQYSVAIANALGQASGIVTTVQVKSCGGPAHSLAAWQNSSDARPCVASAAANPVCAVAAGGYHILTLDVAGRVHGSGKNADGQVSIPDAATNIVALAAGGDHSLALTEDGTVLAWGRNWDGQCTVPASATNVIALAAGWAHSLALRADGNVLAWGNTDYGQNYVSPLAVGVQAIAAGWYHSMALRSDGRVAVWGLDAPTPVNAVDITAIAAGREHCLALRKDGTVIAWGDNAFGQCDVPSTLASVVAISAGYFRSTALCSDGTLVSWGVDQARGVRAPANLTGISTLSTGEQFDSAHLPPAGQPRFGRQLRNIFASANTRPRLEMNLAGSLPMTFQWYLNGEAVTGATNRWLEVNTESGNWQGSYSLFAQNGDGSAASLSVNLSPGVSGQSLTVIGGWGSDRSGQLRVPGGLDNARGVSAGAFHGLAIKADGTLAAWGKNRDGQAEIPPHATNLVQVAAGEDHSLALTLSGSVIAWGRNWDGQANVPAEATNIVRVAAGFAHSLALTADGRVLAWGNNDLGQTNVPMFSARVVAIDAGYYHNLAVLADGSLVVWGLMNALPAAPVIKPVAVSGGWWHSLVLQQNGNVVAWGDNSYGQCNVPAEATNIVAISAGYYASYALRADGTVLAWGARYYGVTNVPAGLKNVSALSAGEDYVLAIAESGEPRLLAPLAVGNYHLGESATLIAEVGGTPPLSFQWLHNGTPIPGANSFSLTLTNLVPSDAGEYSLLVSNRLGQATTFSTTLPVSPNPRVVPLADLHPVALGRSIQLAPDIYGDSAGMQYAWFFNGTPMQDGGRVSGAFSPVLTITGATWQDTGPYSLRVQNPYGTDTALVGEVQVTSVLGFGTDSLGQTTVPTEAREIVGIAAGGDHSLALRNDGTVMAWGDPRYGRNSLPAERLTNIVSISEGRNHSFALTAEGNVVGWGSAYPYLTNIPPEATNVVRIVAGIGEVVALRADGSFVRWGTSPWIPPYTNYLDVALSWFGGVGLLPSGSLLAWGRPRPVPVDATNIVRIAAGWDHTLALRADGTVLAWGDNQYGQCSVPGGLTGVIDVQAGDFFSLALLNDGRVVTWGGSYFDPVPAPEWASGVQEVRAGSGHCLALVARAQSEMDVACTVQGNGPLFVAGSQGLPGSTYQWYHNGIKVAGATNHFLQLPQALWQDRGAYSRLATNHLGEVSSQTVRVRIQHSPIRLSVTASSVPAIGGAPELQVQGLIASGPVVLEASTDLLSWTPVLTNEAAAGSLLLRDPQPVSNQPKFYRVSEVEEEP